MDELKSVPVPSQTLLSSFLAHGLLSTGLCLPQSMLCPLVHPRSALFFISCWKTKKRRLGAPGALAVSGITKSQSGGGSSRGHLLPSDIFMLQTLWTSTPDERHFMRDFCWLYDPPFNYMLKSSLLFNGLRSRPVGYKTVFYPLGRIRM